MTAAVLGQELKQKFERVKALLQRSIGVADRCDDHHGLSILRERLKSFDAAVLFVIVGEVKSGKSSFINALLGDEICEVAPDPCTAVIQELVYGPSRDSVMLGEQWERVFLPAPVLRDISIVDTPGTNSIINNHQTITQKYIPQSDLAIFVFPAKNPHTKSAWDLLHLISGEWHRKVVFVLQQSDLASQKELAVNLERVRQYARERKIQSPLVFSLSAKREHEGMADSGFSEFREYLRQAIESGEVWKLKMSGARETVRRVIRGLHERLAATKAALIADRDFLTTLQRTIKSRRAKADSFRNMAVDSICVTFGRLNDRLKTDFNEGLGLGAILKRGIPLVRDKSVKVWLQDLGKKFREDSAREIEAHMGRLSKDIVAELESLFAELSSAIEAYQAKASSEVRYVNYDGPAAIKRVMEEIQELRLVDVAPVDLPVKEWDSLSTTSLAAGGVTAIGVVLAATTNIIAIDLTGGVLALAGVLVASAMLLWRRSSIIDDLKERLDQSLETFRTRVDDSIEELFAKLFSELEHRATAPMSLIEKTLENTECLLVDCEEIEEATTAN
jgi:ribosome biogenesis GTPase A